MRMSERKTQQLAIVVGIVAFFAMGLAFAQRSILHIVTLGNSTLHASGPQTKETRFLTNFDRIEAGGIYEVDVTFGPNPSVVIEAPRNLLPHLTSKVTDGALELGSDSSYSLQNNGHIKAHVVTRHLTGLNVSGAAKMTIKGKLNADTFKAEASGAAFLTLHPDVNDFHLESSGAAQVRIRNFKAKNLSVEGSGAALCSIEGYSDAVRIEASGSCNVDGKLTAKNADIETSGAAHAKLRVLSSFKGEAEGASSISYSGHPSNVTRNTSGVSSIERSN